MFHARTRLLNTITVASSLLGYLEWGGGNSRFLARAEWDVLRQLVADPGAAAHPFVLIPLVGQIALVVTLFQRRPSATLTYAGIACLGLLLGFMALIGILSLNARVFASTVPFLVLAWLAIRHARQAHTRAT